MHPLLRHVLAVVLVATTAPAVAGAQAQLSITHIHAGIVSSTGLTTSLFDQDTAINLSSQSGVPQIYSATFSSGRALEADETFFLRVTVGLSVWDDGLAASHAPGYAPPHDEFAPVHGSNDLALAWIGVGHTALSEPAIDRWGSLVKLATTSDDQSELYSQFDMPEGTVYAIGQATDAPQTIHLYAAVYAHGGSVSAVPEPHTYASLLVGLAALVLLQAQRVRRRAA